MNSDGINAGSDAIVVVVGSTKVATDAAVNSANIVEDITESKSVASVSGARFTVNTVVNTAGNAFGVARDVDDKTVKLLMNYGNTFGILTSIAKSATAKVADTGVAARDASKNTSIVAVDAASNAKNNTIEVIGTVASGTMNVAVAGLKRLMEMDAILFSGAWYNWC